MTKSLLSSPIFNDETAAREWLEARVWKDGRKCPHCGVLDNSTLMQGKSHRPGLYQCNACREPFSVTVGTLYERSHIPLHKWLAATQLLMSSKKGMAAIQIGRMLGISKKSSWFMVHRIRESLRPKPKTPLQGIVEADETGYGQFKTIRATRTDGTPYLKRKPRSRAKRPIVALVQRGGEVRSFHVPRADKETVAQIVNENVAKEAKLFTDESSLYTQVGANFASHETVRHSVSEYARGGVHTNTIEGYFGIFKKGMSGVYQHCAEKHLHRYLAEFDYRYNHREGLGYDDADRMEASIPGIIGKRLTYRRAHEAKL